MTHRRIWVGLLIPLLAGCGGQAAVPLAPAGDGGSLPSGEYVVDRPPAPFDEGDVVGVTFDEEGLSFTAGCNGHADEHATWADGVVRSGGFAATAISCPGDGSAEDAWFADFLTSSPAITVDGTDVRLASGNTTIWLVPADEVAPQSGPDAPLRGTRWRLTGIEQRDGDSVGMLAVPRRIGATLGIRGRELRFETGCNSGGGRVAVRDEVLRLRQVGVTVVGCNGARGELEGPQVRVLMEKRVRWQVEGEELRLRRGRTTLVYRAR